MERKRIDDSIGADVNVIERHDWITSRQAARARGWLKTGSKRERAALAADFRDLFFDNDAHLSGSYSYLRDKGVDAELPPLR